MNPYSDHLFVRGLSQGSVRVAERAWDEGYAAGLHEENAYPQAWRYGAAEENARIVAALRGKGTHAADVLADQIESEAPAGRAAATPDPRAVLVAADRYARMHREHGHGPEAQEARAALKAALPAASPDPPDDDRFAPPGGPIPGPDPGACPRCGEWRKAGMIHRCPAATPDPPDDSVGDCEVCSGGEWWERRMAEERAKGAVASPDERLRQRRTVLDPETGIEEPVTTGRIPDAEFVEPPLMPPTASPDERLREAGDALANLVTLLGGYDGPGYLAAPNQGEHPDYYAAAKLFDKIMRDERTGAAVVLSQWRAALAAADREAPDEPKETTT